jgi:hypothetical protein
LLRDLSLISSVAFFCFKSSRALRRRLASPLANERSSLNLAFSDLLAYYVGSEQGLARTSCFSLKNVIRFVVMLIELENIRTRGDDEPTPELWPVSKKVLSVTTSGKALAVLYRQHTFRTTTRLAISYGLLKQNK